MEHRENFIIVIDAGHGGWDNGASFEGRLEKDDNLRLALEVQKQFRTQHIDVLMTRDTDVFVELSERANIANEAGADLFISLHRNSYIEQTPYTKGVENFIYLTAPEETTKVAASLVLEAVVDVGVQYDRGVSRGDYYVVRRTYMPAMLLEMGFIINEEDNRLFDEKLSDYAKAIVIGTLRYFGVPYRGEVPPRAPAPPPYEGPKLIPSPVGPLPIQPVNGTDCMIAAKEALNLYYKGGLEEDCELNPQMPAAVSEYRRGDASEGVALIQARLTSKGYYSGKTDGVYGPKTKIAVQMFQRDNYIEPDGIADLNTISKLMR